MFFVIAAEYRVASFHFSTRTNAPVCLGCTRIVGNPEALHMSEKSASSRCARQSPSPPVPASTGKQSTPPTLTSHVARYESATLHHALLPPPMESSWAIVSRGSCSVAAFRFSRRCSAEDVPGINRMLGERCRSHASATCIGVTCSAPAAASSVHDCSGVNPLDTHRPVG
jgi:hypothetical protein